MRNYFEKKRNILDLRGLICPDPIMLLRKTVRRIKKGKIILIISDDVSIKTDIYYFCKFMEHSIIEYHDQYTPFRYLIKKGNVSIF